MLLKLSCHYIGNSNTKSDRSDFNRKLCGESTWDLMCFRMLAFNLLHTSYGIFWFSEVWSVLTWTFCLKRDNSIHLLHFPQSVLELVSFNQSLLLFEKKKAFLKEARTSLRSERNWMNNSFLSDKSGELRNWDEKKVILLCHPDSVLYHSLWSII